MELSPARRALHQNICSYIREFDRQRSELQRLINQVGRQSVQQARREAASVVGQVALIAVGLIALGAAPFTRGISLAGVLVAAGVYYYFQSNANPAGCEGVERGFRRIAAKIQGIVDSLRTRLDSVIASVMDLRAEHDGANQDKVSDLEDRLRASTLNTFRGDVELPEAREHFSGIMEELREVKSLLQQLPSQP